MCIHIYIYMYMCTLEGPTPMVTPHKFKPRLSNAMCSNPRATA